MNYYRYDPNANEFAGIGVSSGEDVVDVFGGAQPLADKWMPVRFHGFDDNPPTEGDFPSLADYRRLPVMSQRAWDALYPIISYCCEALQIIHPASKPFYIIHVMETIDALDEDRSELRRSQIDGRVNRIFKYCLKREMLQGKHIFKLPLRSGGELLVDDVFRKAIEDNALKGLHFRALPMTE